MTIEQLRLAHPRLVYKRFSVEHKNDLVQIAYEFVLEPDLVFRPTITIPHAGPFDSKMFSTFAFHIGLVEAISYWKLACPPEFVIEAGTLTPEQLRFWYDLFLHGLGEFFYQNKIDFTTPNFLQIKSSSSLNDNSEHIDRLNDNSYQHSNTITYSQNKDLLLMSGGKDSAVTAAILSEANTPFLPVAVNPSVATLANLKALGMQDVMVIQRTLDPTLSELNRKGYLNGHTPFSALLAFIGIAVAYLQKSEHVIVSNEQSANEGNVMYRGMEVNHQYSKSFQFEQSFRSYVRSFVTADSTYFSFLRPLNDVQISRLFSLYPKFFTTFRSCNVGNKTNSWCGTCPKCAFTYLVLFPFLSREQMIVSFGGDYFEKPEIITHIKALVGLAQVKPFECVGTKDETRYALLCCIDKYKRENREVPEGLLLIKSDLGLSPGDFAKLEKEVMDTWGDTYNLPDGYITILRSAWNHALHIS